MQIIPTVSPILIDGTGVSTAESSNALCAQCGVTLVPPQKKYCSKKCGTLARVRAHRARQASLKELTQTCDDDYQAERRSAVTNASAGTTRLRHVGKNMACIRAMELEEKIKTERIALRAEFAERRRDLQEQMKSLTAELAEAISEMEERLRGEKS